MAFRRLLNRDPQQDNALSLLEQAFPRSTDHGRDHETNKQLALVNLIGLQRTYLIEEYWDLIAMGSIGRTSVEVGIAHVANIAVAAQLRGRGYGSQLLRGLERAAASMDYTEVRLDATPEAVAFYERNGYEQLRPDTAPITTMVKVLDPAVSGLRVGL